MKNLLVTSRQHTGMITLWLFVVFIIPLNLRLSDTSQSASAVALFVSAFLAQTETVGFVNRMMTWEPATLVPGFSRKIWVTCLGIVGFYIAFASLLSFALGHMTPLIGVAAMYPMVSIYLWCHSRRTGSRVSSVGLTCLLCVMFGFCTLFVFIPAGLRSNLLDSMNSATVQFPAMVIAGYFAIALRKEIHGMKSPAKAIIEVELGRFHPKVAGRFRISGWLHPSGHFLPVIMWLAPILSILGASIASFPVDGSADSLINPLILSVIAGIIVYVGTGTPFGLLKTPSLWMANAWQFGLGESRQSLGIVFAMNIVKASIFPCVVAFGVAFIHAIYIGSSAVRTSYVNFYDEALLLITLNLLCFTWACATYPKRTTACPEFLPIRVVMCTAACLVFIFGVDFGYYVRTLLLITLAGSGLLAIRFGGRLIADIDFIPFKKQGGVFTY